MKCVCNRNLPSPPEHERLQADVARLARELDAARQKIKTLEGGSIGRTSKKGGGSCRGSLDELCGPAIDTPGIPRGGPRSITSKRPLVGPLAISGSHPNVADNNIVGLRQASIHSNASTGLESPTRRYSRREGTCRNVNYEWLIDVCIFYLFLRVTLLLVS